MVKHECFAFIILFGKGGGFEPATPAVDSTLYHFILSTSSSWLRAVNRLILLNMSCRVPLDSVMLLKFR